MGAGANDIGGDVRVEGELDEWTGANVWALQICVFFSVEIGQGELNCIHWKFEIIGNPHVGRSEK